MSRAAESYDNGYAESLFSRTKAELLDGGKFRSLEEARVERFNYIEGYYNRVRRHSGLGYVSPEEYEQSNYEERDRQLSQVLDENQKIGAHDEGFVYIYLGLLLATLITIVSFVIGVMISFIIGLNIAFSMRRDKSERNERLEDA
jgi:hypothetical protein